MLQDSAALFAAESLVGWWDGRLKPRVELLLLALVWFPKGSAAGFLSLGGTLSVSLLDDVSDKYTMFFSSMLVKEDGDFEDCCPLGEVCARGRRMFLALGKVCRFLCDPPDLFTVGECGERCGGRM